MKPTDNQPPNSQAGIPLTPGHDPAAEPVATGNRRDEVHYEASDDPDQMVVMRATHHVDAPLPPQEESAAFTTGETPPQPHLGDVRAVADSPSVWDARPPGDEAEKSGNPTGH
jgi:hypothetical protein